MNRPHIKFVNCFNYIPYYITYDFNFIYFKLNKERESGRDHEDIDVKHGKEDPLNQPHVGGGTWAGGVGKRKNCEDSLTDGI